MRRRGDRTGWGEFHLAGTFPTALTLLVTQEMNRRNIRNRLVEVSDHATELHVPGPHRAEASEVLEDIKRRHRRRRL
ncbi:MAG: hypothetical protein ACE5EI_11135 [Thermodesulfobacteriota bacterium]